MSEFHELRLTRFDFDAADFLASEDVAAMTAGEVGQYVLLLAHAWVGGKDCTLPNDPEVLQKLARAPRGVSKRVMSKFADTVGNRLHNLRLTKEWKDAQVRAQRRHEKAQKAAEKRWEDDAPSTQQVAPQHAASTPQAMLGQCMEMPPTPTPSPPPKECTLAGNRSRARATRGKRENCEEDPLFAKFWNDYPRKIHRRETCMRWKVLGEPDHLAAMEALVDFKLSSQWHDEGGKYIPSPHKFLDDRRWEHPPSALEKGAKPNVCKRPGSPTTEEHLEQLERNARLLGIDLGNS